MVEDGIPDIRDGLSRAQRIVLHELDRARRETGRETIPTVMLYGRVVERLDLSEEAFQRVLHSLGIGPQPS